MSEPLEHAPGTSDNAPTLTVALPVYNGDTYLDEALRGMLGQSFGDFELVINDNASTDRTPEICRDHAAADTRIRYLPGARNVGAPANFELGLAAARGRYFKWMAHDDIHDPDYLRKVLPLLDRAPDVALAHCRVRMAAADGSPMDRYERPLEAAASDDPVERLACMMRTPHDCTTVFGIFRTDLLRRTRLFGTGYHVADRALLAEIALLGRIVHHEQTLFHNRVYPERESLRARPAERQAAFGVPHVTLLRRDYEAMFDRHIDDPAVRRAASAVLRAWWWRDGNWLKPGYERLAWHAPAVYGALQGLRGRAAVSEAHQGS